MTPNPIPTMTTKEPTIIETTIARFSATEATIGIVCEGYEALTITDASDKKGTQAVMERQKHARNIRLAIEKVRVELKGDALAMGKAIDGEANRLKALVAPVEDHCKAERARIAAELQAEADKIEAARVEMVQLRYAALDELGARYSPAHVDLMDDEAFASLRAQEQAAKVERDELAAKAQAEAAEAARVLAEQQEQLRRDRAQANAERIEREKAQAVEDAKRDAERAERKALQDAEDAKLEAKQAAFRAEQAEANRAAAEERAKAEQAKAETERAAREKAQAQAQALAKAEEARRSPMEKIIKRLEAYLDEFASPHGHGKVLSAIITDLEAL